MRMLHWGRAGQGRAGQAGLDSREMAKGRVKKNYTGEINTT